MRTLGLLLTAALSSPLGTPAQRDAARPDTTIDRYVTAKMRSAHIPGVALVIVKGDRIVYERGYGRADPSGRPVTPDTPFLIGSITKSFTALAIMQLVERGLVELDAPVQRYLAWFRAADSAASARITVRQLLTMTSGLPQIYETQVWPDTDGQALERAVRVLRTARLTGDPGRTFGYSNANYDALGMIIQAVTGLSYERYVQCSIFAPLDMRNSFTSQTEAMRHGMASGHRWWFGFPVAVTMPYHRAELPAGYIIASAEDIGHYLVAQMNGGRYDAQAVLSGRGMTFMHREPLPNTYGMGWESIRSNGHRLINHDGGTANSQASLFFDPEARVGVFIAANVLNGLDAFASPSGSSPLDGQTTRGMALTVLSLTTGRPLPYVGPGHEVLTLIFDGVLLVLTALLVLALIRIPARYRPLMNGGIDGRRALVWRVVSITLWNFSLPLFLLYLTLAVPIWRYLLTPFEPDLIIWLDAAALVLTAKWLLELALTVFAWHGLHLNTRFST